MWRITCKYVVPIILIGVGVAAALQCTATNSTQRSLSLSIVSRRNKTGFWTAQIAFEHDVDREEKGVFGVDINHTTTSNCEGYGSVIIVTTLTAPPSQSNSIESEYDLLPDLGYYKIHTEGQTWYKATQTCVREGGHMLILNSDKEFEGIKKIWDSKASSATYLHIGINDFDKEQTYVTIFGEPLNSTGYEKWASGEPTNDKEWNCGRLRRDGKFEDSFCPNENMFVCERSL